jgi:signal transduction histidine kinase
MPVLALTEQGIVLQANGLAHDFFHDPVLRGTHVHDLLTPPARYMQSQPLPATDTGHTPLVQDFAGRPRDTVRSNATPLPVVYANHVAEVKLPDTAREQSILAVLTLLPAPYGFRGVIMDVTHALRMRTKDTAMSAVHAALQDRAEFITTLGREVRAPLNAITMGVSLIEERRIAELCPDPEQRKLLASLDDHCADLQGCCSSILQLVAEVVDMERLRGGLHAYLFEPLDLRVVVETAIRTAVAIHTQSSADRQRDASEAVIETHYAPQVCQYSAWGDGSLLRQMMMHLLMNALQHVPRDGRVAVYVDWEWALGPEFGSLDRALDRLHFGTPPNTQRAMITLRVWNSGSVLAPRVAQKLFKPFASVVARGRRKRQKTDTAKALGFAKLRGSARQGRGIGLSVCQQITETAHGGEISGASDATGTTFTVRLPLFTAVQTVHPPADVYSACAFPFGAPVSRNSGSASTFQTPAPSVSDPPQNDDLLRTVDVLFVEDILSNRKMLLRAMRSHNIKSVGVENGRAAVDWLAAGNRCRLILMDQQMPVMGGAEAARIIHAAHPDIPIVGLTAETDTDEIAAFKDAGLMTVFTKPIMTGDLLKWMCRHLDGAGQAGLQVVEFPDTEGK